MTSIVLEGIEFGGLPLRDTVS